MTKHGKYKDNNHCKFRLPTVLNMNMYLMMYIESRRSPQDKGDGIKFVSICCWDINRKAVGCWIISILVINLDIDCWYFILDMFVLTPNIVSSFNLITRSPELFDINELKDISEYDYIVKFWSRLVILNLFFFYREHT